MHPAISINTLSLLEAPLGALIDRIARLGARGVSPDLNQVIEFGAGNTARAMRCADVKAATLTHRAFSFTSEAEAKGARERLRRSIAIAAEMEAETITMTTGGRGSQTWAEAADRFADAVAPCAEMARTAGVRLGIEPTSHLYADASIVHRLTDAADLARKAGISVVIDLFACWFDADIDTAIAGAGPLTALVQVSDYAYGDRALPCRTVPGDGVLPLDQLIPDIVGAGFSG